MMDQIAGMCRDAASLEVAWRPDDSEAQETGDDIANNGEDLGNYLANHMTWYMEWAHVDGPFVAAYGTMPGYGHGRFEADE